MQRPGRGLQRSGSKRVLDPTNGTGGSGGGGDDDDDHAAKRPRVPALASVIVEALKVDSLQKLCSSLEPILRRVVSEEVERALAKLGSARIEGRSSPKRIEGPDGTNLQLQFRSRLSLPLFTGGKVEGEQGAAIHVVLLDTNTGCVVTSGPESCAKLDVLVLEGDFNNEEDEGWTEEEFEGHIVKEREGKRPLLTGDLQVTLKEGVGTIGELIFTDNSSWIRSRKFRLGLRVASGFCEGIRVRETKTEAFTVKDHRGELYKKHYPPALKDDVWRLEKVGKDGAFHKKLNGSGIYTVEDFLRLLVRDQQRLRSILGSGMSNKMWESLVEHAKTCVLGGKHYIYYVNDSRNIGAIFNNIYEFTGLIADDQFISAENLTDNQKVYADTLVKKAYEDWMHAVEYDGKALLGFKQKKRSVMTRSDTVSASTSNASNGFANTQKQLLSGKAGQTSTGTPSEAAGARSAYNGNQTARYTVSPQNNAANITMQYDRSALSPESQFSGSSLQTQTSGGSNILALEPPQQQQQGFEFSAVGQSMQPANLNHFDQWSHPQENRGVDDYLMEEIRLRSHEILENDEMQQMLRILNMGGASTNMTDDGFTFPPYMESPSPNFNFEDDRTRPPGKAVVGWLKIKAAMRWGIFVRKKAAERRAQLVELDD
ncbi:calmodulin-binding protein 60 D-like isoform X1 [Hordeum vulgare subsp. vulgare]|uniref:Calmodulin-binding protein n=1 Tax=Hordeum vulgare subsp. vulgare TaxID=112509 RepID=A0A8I6Z1F6_HORVV|nr:calmodulin-binding protein 60 D-like isoform X1 [Hordeum vulgare subsp. vulgare]XP_044954683.1 calmodulin-binding protein 60 D-like isoform X1 [Hordeum vulgare subsp. vulgare]